MKNWILSLFIFLSGFAVSGFTLAAQTDKIGSASRAELQAIVDEIAASSHVVGAQVSVVLGDQRADFVYGSANTELNAPMTIDTVTQIGSVTKVFNAALIMTLVDEGKLALDVPAIKYIPDLSLPDKKALQTITLRQLLSMSSGLDNGPHASDLTGTDALARYVASLKTLPQAFAPGKGFGYSNAGICIAGYAAQLAGGASWDALVRQRIFEPAGLNHALTTPDQFPYHRISLGYTPTPDGKMKVNRPWGLSQGEGPAGGTLMTSAHDLASFGALFLNGGKAANGKRVLSEGAVQAMMTPTTAVPVSMPTWGVGEKWGLGPNMSKWDNIVVWGHAGGNQNGVSQLIWIPEKRAVLAFVLNTPAALDLFSVQMFDRFSRAAFGISGPRLQAPEPPPAVANLQRYLGTFTRVGMRYEISEQAGRLRYKQIHVGGMGVPVEMLPLGTLMDAELTALGGDRFLVKMPGQAGGLPVAFFGSDAAGHATNLVDPMFAARRVK